MAGVLFLGLALFAGSVFADPARIAGGQVVRIENFPSIVQVEAFTGQFWTFHCAGAILNVFHILSAAQCFSGINFSTASRRIRAGTAARGTGGVVRYISRAINHPTFGQNGYDGDISVIRLSLHLNTFHPLDNTIRHAPFMAANSHFSTGTPLEKVGWGITGPNSGLSDQLRGVRVRITDHTQCRLNYASLGHSPPVTQNMICATAEGADACDGDQGGPLYLFEHALVGVISWSHGCAVPGFPGVSTSITMYSNWIQAVLSLPA